MLVEARNITKAFGSFRAVDDASLAVQQGTILGLIGPNGAGKSTLFNCLTGDASPTSGEILLDGRNVTRLPAEARARLGLARTFQVPQTFEQLSVLENVMIGAFLRTPDARAARDRARAVIEDMELGAVVDAPARSLGTPGRKRLEIARALATGPKVLLLDEAMAGLMPAEVQRAIALIRRIHASGVTIVIIEHIIEVIVSLAQHVVVMHQGRRIAAGTPAEVIANREVIEAYLGKRRAGGAAAAPPADADGAVPGRPPT
ncbi:MAG: ABC transporter ATP-binding protein [Bradyrhizobiaceae bacterium]|nr:ABC transporter ATP-binding protein [Bradyrhizobiaceae bacterium]